MEEDLKFNPTVFPKQPWVDEDSGIKLRDYFASKIDGREIINGYSYEVLAALVGREKPKQAIELMQWFIEAEAKAQYMKADIMLKVRQ